ncbi:hypothetical protein I79_020160 [Cricetulus griseus]|uniref:Uncharacterized protein n=1 Tax=Cricetulus griseus TaxID=10029 RepID=G3I9C3_CRIGR|nr:hypothetical protein I79_020160 [Cricetulus griseus]
MLISAFNKHLSDINIKYFTNTATDILQQNFLYYFGAYNTDPNGIRIASIMTVDFVILVFHSLVRVYKISQRMTQRATAHFSP